MNYKTILGYLGVISLLCIHFFVFFNKPAFASLTPKHTTIRLEIIAAFTGTATSIGGTTIVQNNTYRASGYSHILNLQGALSGNYFISGSVNNSSSGQINPGNSIFSPVELTTGEGEKNFFVVYTAIEGIHSGSVLSIPLQITVDTTPPALSTGITGPIGQFNTSIPLSFTRNPVIDSGIGLGIYSIQISNNPLFTSAMEFTTTGVSLTLGGGSLSVGQRYRRWTATDILGNTTFSTPSSFTILAQSQSHGAQSSVNNFIHTPSSDQCPAGDSSGNYFDGLCTTLISPPVLINIPGNQQIKDKRSFIEKLINIPGTKKQTPSYTFPNYPTPKLITLYEETPFYQIQGLKNQYQKTNTSSFPTENAGEDILTVRKPIGSIRAGGGAFVITIYENQGINYINYLFERYKRPFASCNHIGAYCSIEAICSAENCLTENLICDAREYR